MDLPTGLAHFRSLVLFYLLLVLLWFGYSLQNRITGQEQRIDLSRCGTVDYHTSYKLSHHYLLSDSINQARGYPTMHTFAEGEILFKTNCANCHARNMVSYLTGPALAGVQERWADYPEEDLHAWIRNSQQLIAEGHPRAVELWGTYQNTVMNSFPNLTDEEIQYILDYISAKSSI